MQQSRIFVGMVLILIFGEVLGLYGYVFILKTTDDGEILTTIQTDRVTHSEHPRTRLSHFDRQDTKSKKEMNSPCHSKASTEDVGAWMRLHTCILPVSIITGSQRVARAVPIESAW